MNRSEAPEDGAAPSEREALERDAARYGLRLLDAVPDDLFDPALVSKLPVEWARSNGMLPVRIDGEACVLTSDVSRLSRQEDLSLLIGVELQPVLAPRDVVTKSIEQCYFSRDNSPDDFMKGLASGPVVPGLAAGKSDDLLAAAEQAPVTKLVNLILLEAVKRRASDIHFEPFESRLRVRYRVDGVLYEQTDPPKHLEDALVSRLKVMGHMDIAERRLPQDGMARVSVGEREIDIRVSTVPVAEGERVVLRLLDRDAVLLPLDVLGLPAEVRQDFATLLHAPNGIIVVCGPTGSGKTTTLYAALGRLDATRQNILTIEDPIEYQLPDIGQIQVKPKIGLSFSNGLRHILRQDPDVILIGETRDIETADIAVRASLTGHLVFTTLHTNDAPGAVTRLLDMGTEPYLLASSLRGVLAQRLVRTLCTACRAPDVPPDERLVPLGAVGARLRGASLWRPVGCAACLEGYSGRTGVFELLLIDAPMQEAIRSGHAGAAELRGLARTAGLRTLTTDGVAKVRDGVTSLAEVLSVASA